MPGVKLPKPELVSDLAQRLGGRADDAVLGARVDRVCSPRDAERDLDLVVVTSARFVAEALGRSGVWLVAEALAPRFPEGRRWIHPHAAWALAELLDAAEPPAPERPRIDPSARVERGAEVAADVRLGPGAVVLSGASVGAGSCIGPNAVIYGGAQIGRRVSIGPLAVIGRPGFGWVTGPEGRVRRMPQLGGVIIEDDVEIGALASVDAGTLGPTRIGAGAKLDAHVHVGHNVEIGPGCLIAAQAGFAGSSRLGAGVLVGGQAGVTDHASVGAGARLGAKSGVVGDVPEGAAVAGFPAVPKMRFLRAMAKLYKRGEKASR